jgi:Transposase protein
MHYADCGDQRVPGILVELQPEPVITITSELNALKIENEFLRMRNIDLENQVKRCKVTVAARNHLIKVLRNSKRRTLSRDKKALDFPKKALHNQHTQTEVNEMPKLTGSIQCQGIISQIIKRSEHSTPNKYNQDLREFALKLHYYSPKAYDYAREMFQCTLPHPNSLRIWTSAIDTSPGKSNNLDLLINYKN